MTPITGVPTLRVILPFNYNRLEQRYPLFILIIAELFYKDDSLIDSGIQDMLEDHPNRECEYHRLHRLVTETYADLKELSQLYLFPHLKREYVIMDVFSLGGDLCVILDDPLFIDFSTPHFYNLEHVRLSY